MDKLITVLEGMGVPFARIFFEGEAEAFLVYFRVSEGALHHADDRATQRESLFRVDIYAKQDYTALLTRLTAALEQAEFYGIEINSEDYERDTGYYHVPVEFYGLEDV